MIVEEIKRDLGNFFVGRLLPSRKKKRVGPFVFIDHMMHSKIGPEQYIDVNQHPHVGLSTLTYLFEGEMEHRDSTGSVKRITPGNVGFMTAGKGVTHTERTPNNLRNGQVHTVHGYQIWIALPKGKEDMEPRFDYFSNETLPQWDENDVSITLIAGRAFEKFSPLKGYSDLFMMDAFATKNAKLALGNRVTGEVGLLVTKGSITHSGEEIVAGQMIILDSSDDCDIGLVEGTRILILGGKPLPEERYIEWNFVATSKERIRQAKTDWQQKKFPKVPEDNSYIPYR